MNECADWSNKGICSNQKCRLPHVDRAGQIRKLATGSINVPSNSERLNFDDPGTVVMDVVRKEETSDNLGSSEFTYDAFIGEFDRGNSSPKGADFVQL